MCGPDTPCVLLRDETLDAPAFRNHAPAIALDSHDRPRILFSIAEYGYRGHYARRGDDGTWSIQSAMTAASAALVLDRDDIPTALVADGAGETRLWRGAGDGWQPREIVPGHGGWPQGLAATTGGCLYAPLLDDDYAPRLAARDTDGTWSTRPLGDHADGGQAITLDPSGAPHVIGWHTDDGGWGSYYARADDPTRLVRALDSPILEWLPVSIAATDGDDDVGPGTPHILHSVYNGTPPGQYGVDVVYSTRATDGSWNHHTVARGDPDEFSQFPGAAPPGGDDTGDPLTTYRAMAALAAGDDVRLLYARYLVTGDAVTGRLELAWPAADTTASQVLADGVAPLGLTAAIDSRGRLHVALYDGAAAWGDSTVRYLMFGPAP